MAMGMNRPQGKGAIRLEKGVAKGPAGKIATGKNIRTRITIKYDAGFNNNLFIRGQGAGLSWEKGKQLKNVGANEWIWETDAPFKDCEFKVLINDQLYEAGENHRASGGQSMQYTPSFG